MDARPAPAPRRLQRVPEDLFARADSAIGPRTSLADRGERFDWFADPLRPALAVGCAALLEHRLLAAMKRYSSGIPPQSITSMRRNYEEVLGKTFSSSTAFLNGGRSRAVRAAADIGLLAAMRSPAALHLAERLSGFRLRKGPGCQVICYGPGDHVGPHNDHHPEDENLRHGYIDLHLTLCASSVEHQYLVHERNGFLSECHNVATLSGVSVSHLPFWHYVTPLVLRRGARQGRRWLILCSFEKA